MNTLFSSEVAILATLSVSVAFAFFSQKYKWAKFMGPALICVVSGIILSNFNILPHWHDAYGKILEYAIPVSLSIMLLNINLKEWLKLSREPLMSMLIACLSVMIMAFVGGLFFAPRIDEGWKIAGMFVGTYTGGSSNLTAIGTGLNATPTAFGAANAADYVVGIPTLILFFALPPILNRSKLIRKVWPYSFTEQELTAGGSETLFGLKQWSVTDIALLLGIGLTVTAVSTTLSTMFSPLVQSAMRIIFITTIAIAVAQFKPVREIKGNTDVGVLIAGFFLVVIGLTIDIKEFMNSAPLITLYCFVTILGSLVLHILVCRLLKIKYQYVLISVVAGIADGSTSALVAAAGNWQSIISTAVILGAIGNAAGNYLGIGVAYLLKAVIGA